MSPAADNANREALDRLRAKLIRLTPEDLRAVEDAIDLEIERQRKIKQPAAHVGHPAGGGDGGGGVPMEKGAVAPHS